MKSLFAFVRALSPAVAAGHSLVAAFLDPLPAGAIGATDRWNPENGTRGGTPPA